MTIWVYKSRWPLVWSAHLVGSWSPVLLDIDTAAVAKAVLAEAARAERDISASQQYRTAQSVSVVCEPSSLRYRDIWSCDELEVGKQD